MITSAPQVPTQRELDDPAYAFYEGAVLADSFDVTANPFTDAAAYEAAMHELNPRTPKKLDRFMLEGATTRWSKADRAVVMSTAGRLGILAAEYPFGGERVDAGIVAEGARTATLDRGRFALDAVRAGKLDVRNGLWVAGSDRRLDDQERALVEEWAPDAITGFDVADAAVAKLQEEYADVLDEAEVTLSAFHIETPEPDTRDVVAELIDRRREAGDHVGSIAMATTALYVPFKTHKSWAVAKPRGVETVVRGIASRPEIVKARTVDTYLAEICTTLASAAQHVQARE